MIQPTNKKPTLSEVYKTFKELMGFKKEWELIDNGDSKMYDGNNIYNYVAQNKDGSIQVGHKHVNKLKIARLEMSRIYKACKFIDTCFSDKSFTIKF